MTEPPFQFKVFEPEQRKGGGPLDFAYWSYKIIATTNLSQYPRQQMEVHRRYSDFEYFRAQLSELFPFCIIPPIPEKDLQGSIDKFVGAASESAARLREYRQRALKKFLDRLGAHPSLHTSQILKDFLEMDEAEWERKVKAISKKNIDRSLASTIGEGVNHALTRQWNTTGGSHHNHNNIMNYNNNNYNYNNNHNNNSSVAAATGSSYTRVMHNTGRTDPQVWEETKLYIQQLEDSIKMLRERVQMLVERRRSTSNALREFGVAFEKVGEVEKGIKSTPLSNALIEVGQHSETLSLIYNDYASDEAKNVVENLSYYYGMCAAVRETLKRLQHKTHQVNSLTQHASEVAMQKDKLVLKTGQADKVAKLENELHLLQERLDEARKELETGENIFKEEIRRFHREKQYDVKAILKTFAELQLKYAANMKEKWENLLPSLEKAQADEENSGNGKRNSTN